MGCLPAFIGICVVLILICALLFTQSVSLEPVRSSTIQRQPLSGRDYILTGYYTDELDWISDKSSLESGMRHFMQKTGIQPYVWISGNIDGNGTPSDQQFKSWCEEKYDELFEDEAHLFWLFFENGGEYSFWYALGKQSQVLLNDEALNIIHDYFEQYYYSEFNESEMIGRAFSDAADRMMSVTRPWYYPVLIVLLGVAALAALLVFFNKRKKLKVAEKQANADVLNAPIDDLPPRH